ncbi:MAG: hypothetical protein LC778_03075 [Acidobacteria bacterium]|nr:hypothetical protein [Acidobacteriota bacterium]
MKKTLLKTIGAAALAILMLAVSAQIFVSAQGRINNLSVQEDLSQSGGARTLEGSWSVQTTVYNCQTGATLQTFPKMNTFMQGGTMQEFSAGGSFLRGPAHGVWYHERGQSYSYALQFFRFNADGTYAGLTRARWQVNLDLTGNSYTANTATIEIINPAGVVVNRLCATETATRFE